MALLLGSGGMTASKYLDKKLLLQRASRDLGVKLKTYCAEHFGWCTYHRAPTYTFSVGRFRSKNPNRKNTRPQVWIYFLDKTTEYIPLIVRILMYISIMFIWGQMPKPDLLNSPSLSIQGSRVQAKFCSKWYYCLPLRCSSSNFWLEWDQISLLQVLSSTLSWKHGTVFVTMDKK